jgi:hypothetical protein
LFGCLVATFALPLVAIKGGDGHEEPNKSTKKTKNGGGDKAAASGAKAGGDKLPESRGQPAESGGDAAPKRIRDRTSAARNRF